MHGTSPLRMGYLGPWQILTPNAHLAGGVLRDHQLRGFPN